VPALTVMCQLLEPQTKMPDVVPMFGIPGVPPSLGRTVIVLVIDEEKPLLSVTVNRTATEPADE
jgi:hypothetical protein